MKAITEFHIHGDNIVECERALELIKSALADDVISALPPAGSPVCPVFNIGVRYSAKPLKLTFYPGFGRWRQDILELVRHLGGTLREAPDVIITGIISGTEIPLVAIEFCGALPAGNQAWQRSGRAYSFGKARVPYLYVAELGGYELDRDRNRKSPRMPNPAVPFSYLSYSVEQGTDVLPIFTTSQGADDASRAAYAGEFAERELVALIRALLLQEDSSAIYATLRLKVLSLVRKRAEASKGGKTLSPRQWDAAYAAVSSGQPLAKHLAASVRIAWSKTAYIKSITKTAVRLMTLAKKYAIGLTSSELPICIIPRKNRRKFAAAVSKLYMDLPTAFTAWLKRDDELIICWVMGFKPRGDDARPDRGLPPFARMLVGRQADMLTVVYGPAHESTWPMLQNAPIELMEKNGLWEAILETSDALLVDASTDKVTHHGFLRSHWASTPKAQTAMKVFVDPMPVKMGENDVDTALHLLLAHCSGNDVFEGMCNPPGGDWSGVSLQTPDRSLELRWLSLPRVSGADKKRPDHVFQFFNIAPRPVVLSVESKERAQSVEERIGPRLSAYITSLLDTEASVQRVNGQADWAHSTRKLNKRDFIFATGVAFISGSQSEVESVIAKSKADLVMSYVFGENGESCEIRCTPTSEVGKAIADCMVRINPNGMAMHFAID